MALSTASSCASATLQTPESNGVFGAEARYEVHRRSPGSFINPFTYLLGPKFPEFAQITVEREIGYLNPHCQITVEVEANRTKHFEKMKVELLKIPEITEELVDSLGIDERYVILLADTIDKKILDYFDELLNLIEQTNGVTEQTVKKLKKRIQVACIKIYDNNLYVVQIRTLPRLIQKVANAFLFHIGISESTQNGSKRTLYIKKSTCDFVRRMFQGGTLYESSDVIGSGGAANVKLMEMRGSSLDPKAFAVKVPKEGKRHQLEKELKISGAMPSHSALMEAVFARRNPRSQDVEMVMEVATNNLLRHLCKNPREMDVRNLISGIADVLKGLIHVHKNGVFHRDIKLENILVKDGSYFLCDFGLSQFKDDASQPSGSIFYVPIEMFLQGSTANVSEKSDIWSLALTIMATLSFQVPIFNLYEFVCKEDLYKLEEKESNALLGKFYNSVAADPESQERVHAWIDTFGTKSFPIYGKGSNWLSPTKFESLRTMLKAMLMIDPSKRISAEDSLKSSVFEEFIGDLSVEVDLHK